MNLPWILNREDKTTFLETAEHESGTSPHPSDKHKTFTPVTYVQASNWITAEKHWLDVLLNGVEWALHLCAKYSTVILYQGPVHKSKFNTKNE